MLVKSALLVIVLLALTACAAPSQPATPKDGSGKPKPGGTVNIRIPNDPYDWDLSYLGKSIPGNIMQSQPFNSLVGFKSGPGMDYNDLVLRPELAERWEVSRMPRPSPSPSERARSSRAFPP